MSATEVVRAAFDAYRAQDRAAMEALLADDFRFSSPQDDRLGRAAYFERCFPTAHRFARQEILRLAPDGADGVLVLYECDLATGGTFRNVEHHTVRQGRITEVWVYFGGEVGGPS